jgi:phosphate-selective porin OprO/OprP
MKLVPSLLAVAVLAALTSSPARAEIAIDQFDFFGGSEVSFEGLIQTDYDDFHNDVANLNGSAADGLSSDAGMRRAELVLKGKSVNYDWVLGYDARAAKFLDVNVKWKFSANTGLTVGQFKQPNSLEELTSTKNNDFISKSMTDNTFAITRRLGIGFNTGDDNWTVAASVFGREMTVNLGEGNGFGARATWAPINESGNVLHLGISGVDLQAKDAFDNPVARVRSRPDADLSGTRLIDTGNLTDARRIRTLGAEAAWIHGPIKLQGEYMTSRTSRSLHPDFTGDSWYVYGVWNITGETWGYKAGLPTTPLPNAPATGMWQVALRYDEMDLNDGSLTPHVPFPIVNGVLGGKEHNITAGVNWYWHSNFKFSLNYVKVMSDKYSTAFHKTISDNPNIFEARAQFYF